MAFELFWEDWQTAAACSLYALGCLTFVLAEFAGGSWLFRRLGVSGLESAGWSLMALGLVFHAFGILAGWEAVGHGPFISMREVLSSNVFSLLAAALVAGFVWPDVRRALALSFSVAGVMVLWMFSIAPANPFYPPTFDTPWQIAHVLAGKVFLGAVFVSLGLSFAIMIGRSRFWGVAGKRSRPKGSGGAVADDAVGGLCL